MILFCVIAFCLLSTMIGAISGIGGGVIIKPMLDLTVPLDMARISLISSFAVLSMSLFSVGKAVVKRNTEALKLSIALPLATGATVGGVLGKMAFQHIAALLQADVVVKAVQNSVLFVLMLLVLINAMKDKAEKMPIARSPQMGVGVGAGLGVLAAFLGIGGGPLNMLALTCFYCMRHKEAALYSLFVIVFSQTAGVITALTTNPAVMPSAELVVTACVAGILGGIIGRRLAARMSNHAVKMLYNAALVLILVLCFVNISSLMLPA